MEKYLKLFTTVASKLNTPEVRPSIPMHGLTNTLALVCLTALVLQPHRPSRYSRNWAKVRLPPNCSVSRVVLVVVVIVDVAIVVVGYSRDTKRASAAQHC